MSNASEEIFATFLFVLQCVLIYNWPQLHKLYKIIIFIFVGSTFHFQLPANENNKILHQRKISFHTVGHFHICIYTYFIYYHHIFCWVVIVALIRLAVHNHIWQRYGISLGLELKHTKWNFSWLAKLPVARFKMHRHWLPTWCCYS